MRRTRHILTLLGAPLWALNAQRGLHRMAAMAGEAQRRMGGAVAMEDDAGTDRTPEERASYWRELLIDSGLYPYYVNPDGGVVQSLDPDWSDKLKSGAVAVVPFNGMVVKECSSWEEVFWGLVSSKRINAFQQHLLAEDRVVGMVKVYNSPGGMVDGTEALGLSTKALSVAKPTVALVDGLAASAAYWDACNHRSIQLLGQTTEIGSVGVMLALWDVIPYFESIGFKYHELYAPESAKKNEGWRALHGDKDPGVLKDELSYFAQLFRNVVVEARGTRVQQDPAALEGRVYPGQLGIDAGLADGFADLSACIALVRPTATVDQPLDDAADPDPIELTNDANATAATPTRTMNLKQRAVALIAALFGSKESVTADDLNSINAELNEKGITGLVVVNEADAAAATEATTRIAEAQGQAAELRTQLDAATAEVATITTERDEARAQLATANEQVTNLTAELATANTRVAELENASAGDRGVATNAAGDASPNGGEGETDEERLFREQAEAAVAKRR